MSNNNDFPGSRKIESVSELVPGVVIRHYFDDGSSEPFSDAIVLKVEKGCITFVRPYVYASGTNTMCPTPMMWAETVKEVPFSSLVIRYRLVVSPRGNVSVMDVTR